MSNVPNLGNSFAINSENTYPDGSRPESIEESFGILKILESGGTVPKSRITAANLVAWSHHKRNGGQNIVSAEEITEKVKNLDGFAPVYSVNTNAFTKMSPEEKLISVALADVKEIKQLTYATYTYLSRYAYSGEVPSEEDLGGIIQSGYKKTSDAGFLNKALHLLGLNK